MCGDKSLEEIEKWLHLAKGSTQQASASRTVPCFYGEHGDPGTDGGAYDRKGSHRACEAKKRRIRHLLILEERQRIGRRGDFSLSGAFPCAIMTASTEI